MKRFFQPVAGACSKKPKLGGGEGGGEDRRDFDHDATAPTRPDPLTFITWNANSLLGRLRVLNPQT